jgi:pimeloyl-ACP methyl ester carboxylesterase
MQSRPMRLFNSAEQALDHYHRLNPSLTREQTTHLVTHGLRRQDNGGYAWKFDDLSRKPSQVCASEHEIQQLISCIQCPVLLPWGGRSFFSLAENRERIGRFANARVCLYPEAGHWPHHSDLNQFIEDLNGFIDLG